MRQDVRDFISEYEREHGIKVSFPVLYDETNWLAIAMNIDFLPTILTVDAEGKVQDIYRSFGEKDDAEIIAGIEELVKKLYVSTPARGGGGK